MMNRLSLIAFLLLAVIGGAAFGQNQADLSGKVLDQNGAVIVGARVTLNGPASPAATVTNQEGRFQFQNLPFGEYEVRVLADGFAPYSQRFFVARAGQIVDVALAIGEKRVTVTAEVGSEIELVNVPQSISVIDTQKLLERSGSVLAQVAEEEVGLNVQKTSPTIGAVVVRGLTGKNVVNYVDGVRYTNSAQRGGINTFFNLNDASNLQAIEVLRGPNSAQYGSDSLGGTVNLLTKS